MRTSVVRAAAISLLLWNTGSAQLPDAQNGGIRIFEPQYYVEFDPVSALELVFRTPGFQPQEQDGGRGLSGVRSNVLIDGERPPPKGRSIRQQLREMPVDGVAFIELIDAGARLDIDMQGYPQVVNVITVENPPAYYEFETQFMEAGTGKPDQQNAAETQIQGTGTFYWREHSFTTRGSTQDRTNESPSGFVSIDPANPVQRLSSINRQERQNESLQLNAEFSLPEDSSLSVTSQFSTFDRERYPVSLDEPDDDLDRLQQNNLNDNQDRELSAEYRRPFGSRGELMFAFVDALNDELSESSLSSATITRSSLNDRESGETASRLLITSRPTDQLTVRTTASRAHNFFDGRFQLYENGIEIPVDGSDSRVAEDRQSLESGIDWNWSDKWTLQSTVGFESYDIRSRDTASGRQTNPRGNIKLSFRPQPRTTFSLESQRVIGQLSFSQFLASSSLSSEIVSAGAADLEPVRRWIHSANFDKRFGDVGVLRVDLQREQRDNPIRTVALSNELTVSQNTSKQVIDSLQASVEFPFEQLSREDLILEVTGYIADSETVDPVTGETRAVSGVTDSYWQIGLRKDPGDSRLAWSFNLWQQNQGDNFSVRQTSTQFVDRQWQASVEWEVIDGLRLGAELQGPQTQIWRADFFGAVREPGLNPSFMATTITRQDRAGSFSVEWRRRDHLEVRLSLSTQPKIITHESLLPFGDSVAAELEQQIARTPRAWLRFRYYR